MLAVLAAIPLSAFGQVAESLDVSGKLSYQAEATYKPMALLGVAAYAGVLQADGAPKEWGGGGGAYGQRYASTLAWVGIHSALAFSLDSALHQDPRYYRSGDGGFWK